MTKPIDLYAMGWQDRSDRVRWLLEEMGVPYTNHWLKKSAGEMNTPEYRKLNPMGRVPTIVDGDIILSESAAVCMYLADRYSYGTLAPKMEDVSLRAEYTKWMVFSVGTLECVIARMFTHVNTPEETAVTHKFVKEQSELFKLVLNPILEKQDYILQSGFSAADIMLAAVIPGAQDYLVTNNPPIQKYMDRMMARTAAIKAKVF
ncbi:glutathione S-transferase family protein [Bacteriovorax sp. PP10]|uniref:Glutathione S-transferase family protein n=1 Tax=Bacteriovorax antarcticus TaxID=3088717 RepID=A0ABU5VYE6_9BACT|nr:glutathione S-transferase family protein [Bacteriovorax sp. PP10]MEA9358021.1 glutathione S-transferase family protein [Bacteriovorax sp. PP10]